MQTADAAFQASAARGFTTRAAVLRQPTMTTATAGCTIGGRTVDLAWTVPADDRTALHLERATETGAFATLGVLAAAATGYSDSTTSLLASYSYRVTSARASWSSSPSATATVGILC